MHNDRQSHGWEKMVHALVPLEMRVLLLNAKINLLANSAVVGTSHIVSSENAKFGKRMQPGDAVYWTCIQLGILSYMV